MSSDRMPLRHLMNQVFTLRKITKTLPSTGLESTFGVPTETVTTYTIKGRFQAITTEDEMLARLGGLRTGDAIVYLHPFYFHGTTKVTPTVGDELEFGGVRWDIDSIREEWGWKDKQYMRAVLIKKVG